MLPPSVRASALLFVVAALWPHPARAGETACWYEADVLVVPAEVMGVAGDYVLDTGAPRTLLHDTAAEGAGYAGAELAGSVRLAGLILAERPVQVTALDARLRRLPTPVAGVIGVDVLAGRVLDVQFAPCRVTFSEAAQAAPFGPAVALPIAWRGGRPTALAAAADGSRTLSGAFVVATGSDTAVRLRDDLVAGVDPAQLAALYPYGQGRRRLRALSFAGDLFEDLPSGLAARAELEADGEIGGPVLSHYRLRFDFARDQLLLAKQKGPPDRSDGP